MRSKDSDLERDYTAMQTVDYHLLRAIEALENASGSAELVKEVGAVRIVVTMTIRRMREELGERRVADLRGDG